MSDTDSERSRRFEAARERALGEGTAIQRETSARLRSLLEEAERRIAAILSGAPSDFRLWQLTELQRQVRAELAKLVPAGEAALHAGHDRSHAAGQELIDAPLRAGGVEIAGEVARLDVRKLDATRAFLTDRIKDIASEAAGRISAEIAMAATGVISPEDAARTVAETLKEGGMKRARSIVRTELGGAFSTAAQERQEQAARIVPGMQKQWRRSSKLHSRYEHDAIDGQIQDVDKPFQLPNGVRMMYPRDPAAPIGERMNCGCTSLPYMASWTVTTPDRRAVTDEERAKSRGKRVIADAFE